MSSFESDFAFNQSIKLMQNYFLGQNSIDMIGNLALFTWFFAGIFSYDFLYLFSMIIVTVAWIINLFDNTLNQRIAYRYQSGSARRAIVALLAYLGYTTGSSIGSTSFAFFGMNIPILIIAQYITGFFTIYWLGSRYIDFFNTTDLYSFKTLFLILRGIVRGVIILGALYALFTKYTIEGTLGIILFSAYIIEPIIYYFYSQVDRTVSTIQLTLGNSRLPAVALRESFFSNFLLLILTIISKGVSGSEWQLLVVVYFFGLAFTLAYSRDSIKKFNKNPFGNSPIGNFLNNISNDLDSVNLNDKTAHVIEKQEILNLGKNTSLKIDPGSLIVPLGTDKGMIKTLVIGKGENIVRKGDERISEILEGVSTVLLPVKNFKKISKAYTAQRLSTLNLSLMNLPSLDKLQTLVDSLSFNLGGWIGNLKDQMMKMPLSSYSITETNGITKVVLPGINVVDGRDVTQVNVMNLVRVYENPNATFVKIGSFLNVVEFPKMTFVTMPGLTVLDTKDGTAVDLFGMKISDGISADKIEEFKEAFFSQMTDVQQTMDEQLGKILADDKAAALMSISFDGEFKPLLEGQKRTFGDHIALGQSSEQSRKLLTGYTPSQKTITQESKLIALTGLNAPKVKKENHSKESQERREQRKEYREKKKETRKEYKEIKKEIKRSRHLGVEGSNNSSQNVNNLIDQKQSEINKQLNQAFSKDNQDSKKKKDKSEFKNIIDADYEILDDDDDS